MSPQGEVDVQTVVPAWGEERRWEIRNPLTASNNACVLHDANHLTGDSGIYCTYCIHKDTLQYIFFSVFQDSGRIHY